MDWVSLLKNGQALEAPQDCAPATDGCTQQAENLTLLSTEPAQPIRCPHHAVSGWHSAGTEDVDVTFLSCDSETKQVDINQPTEVILGGC